MKALVLLAFFFAVSAHADSLAEQCARKVEQKMIARAHAHQPSLSEDTVRAYLAGEMPEASYVMHNQAALCVANRMKSELMSPGRFSRFATYCPAVKSGIKIECFNAWLAHQNIGYAQASLQLAKIASDLAQADTQIFGRDKQVIAPLLVSANLTLVEKYSTAKNVAYQLTSAHAAEWREMRTREEKSAHVTRKILLTLSDKELKAGQSRRTPTSDGPWPALAARLARLR